MSENKKRPVGNPDILQKRIKATFPNLSWSSYRYIDDGWDHEVLILDEKLVFRFPNDADYAESLETEITVLKQLGTLTKVRIPHYSYIAPDFSFAGYQIVEGKQLSVPLFQSLNAEEKSIISTQLADLISMMHNLLSQGHDFSIIPLSDMRDEQPTLKEQAEKNLKPLLNPDEYSEVEQILADTDQLLQRDLPTVLLHGDLYSSHFLWHAASKQLGVIDFSDMNRGDPAFDFAELYEYGEEFVRA